MLSCTKHAKGARLHQPPHGLYHHRPLLARTHLDRLPGLGRQRRASLVHAREGHTRRAPAPRVRRRRGSSVSSQPIYSRGCWSGFRTRLGLPNRTQNRPRWRPDPDRPVQIRAQGPGTVRATRRREEMLLAAARASSRARRRFLPPSRWHAQGAAEAGIHGCRRGARSPGRAAEEGQETARPGAVRAVYSGLQTLQAARRVYNLPHPIYDFRTVGRTDGLQESLQTARRGRVYKNEVTQALVV